MELPLERPRLGRPDGPLASPDGRSPSALRTGYAHLLWPITTLTAATAMTALIGIGFLAAPQTPASIPEITPATVEQGTLLSQSQLAGPPLFTGSIPVEVVQVTPASLSGPLFGSAPQPPLLLPTAAAGPATQQRTYSTALAPTPRQGQRSQISNATVLPIEPVRLASLTPQAPTAPGPASASLEPRTQIHTIIVAPGETLGAILKRYGLDTRAEVALVNALRAVFAPKNLRAGQEVFLTVVDNTDTDIIPVSLTFSADVGDVVVSRKADGSYTGAIDGALPGTAVNRRAISRIQSSLYGAARSQKVPDAIIVRMMNTHSYDVDFQREIRPGDTFEMFYTNGQSDGISPRGRGTLLFSSLTTSGKKKFLPFHQQGRRNRLL